MPLSEEELEAKVAQGLETVNATPEDEPVAEVTPEPEETLAAAEPAASDDSAPAASEATLPDAYVRAAVHQGWTEEDVKELFEAKPEAALKTFKKMLDDTNNLSKIYADMGRTKTSTPVPAVTPAPATTKKFDVGIEKIREQYQNDPIIDGVIAPLEKALNDMYTELQAVKAHPVSAPSSAMDDANTEHVVNGFFAGMKQFSNEYGELTTGKNWSQALTPGQQTNRMAVCQVADQLLAGATMQGRTMGFEEAMNLAHMLITQPIQEKVIRAGIKATLQKKAKSQVLKPTGTAKEAVALVDKGKKGDMAVVEKKVAQRLDKFNKTK